MLNETFKHGFKFNVCFFTAGGFFAFIMIYLLRMPSGQKLETIDYLFYLLGLNACPVIGLSSAFAHIFFCHSESVFQLCSHIDHFGMTSGLTMLLLTQNYFLFRSDHWFQILYCGASLIFALIFFLMSFQVYSFYMS